MENGKSTTKACALSQKSNCDERKDQESKRDLRKSKITEEDYLSNGKNLKGMIKGDCGYLSGLMIDLKQKTSAPKRKMIDEANDESNIKKLKRQKKDDDEFSIGLKIQQKSGRDILISKVTDEECILNGEVFKGRIEDETSSLVMMEKKVSKISKIYLRAAKRMKRENVPVVVIEPLDHAKNTDKTIKKIRVTCRWENGTSTTKTLRLSQKSKCDERKDQEPERNIRKRKATGEYKPEHISKKFKGIMKDECEFSRESILYQEPRRVALKRKISDEDSNENVKKLERQIMNDQ